MLPRTQRVKPRMKPLNKAAIAPTAEIKGPRFCPSFKAYRLA
ncbi:hypothetical protein [Acaryochloris thomasi]|nr:hypothetical protein [Acaryochloris thomasi]